nr:glutaredoxin domain-containing protein [Candidatus Sigynarchaeota archaeon]
MTSEPIELFSTTTCARCKALAAMLDAAGVAYVKREIDVDPEAMTDALMLGILEIPVLRRGDNFFRCGIDLKDVKVLLAQLLG